MNITVNARHMEVTEALREYAEEKAARFPKFYDNIQSIEVIMDIEAGKPQVEIVVQATRKATFVAHHREDDMYACVDQCSDKIVQQLRRHKDKMRDRKGSPNTKQMVDSAQAQADAEAEAMQESQDQ